MSKHRCEDERTACEVCKPEFVKEREALLRREARKKRKLTLSDKARFQPFESREMTSGGVWVARNTSRAERRAMAQDRKRGHQRRDNYRRRGKR